MPKQSDQYIFTNHLKAGKATAFNFLVVDYHYPCQEEGSRKSKMLSLPFDLEAIFPSPLLSQKPRAIFFKNLTRGHPTASLDVVVRPRSMFFPGSSEVLVRDRGRFSDSLARGFSLLSCLPR